MKVLPVRGRRELGPAFRRLLAAGVATRFADSSRMAAFGVLAVSLTSNPHLVSAVAAMNFVPWLLFGLLAGVLVDRWDKRRAFLVADLLRCLIAGLLVVAVLTGQVSIGVVLVAAFVLTSLQTVSDSCLNSMLPAVVGKEQLGPANARLSMAQSGVGQLAGGPAGSSLYAWQPAAPFVGNVLFFLVGASQVRRLPREGEPHADRRSTGLTWQEFTAGLRWLAREPIIRALTLATVAMNFASGVYQGILPLYALHTMQIPVSGYGALAGTIALAMICGNFVAGRLMQRIEPTALSRVAIGGQVVAFVIVGSAPAVWVMFVGVALYGFTAGLWNVPWMSILMGEAPADIRGRVMAAYRTVAVSALPLGAVLAGLVASVAGNRAPFLACVCGVGLAALGLLRVLRRRHGRASDATDGVN